MRPDLVTLAKGTIHNPDEPRDFMKLKPVAARVRIFARGRLLAQTRHALRLIEVGNDLYDPALYIPEEDLAQPLERSEKATFCPLKGAARYLSLPARDGAAAIDDIGWTYADPLPVAAALKGRVAFDPTKVTIEEASDEPAQDD
jgi:uncharacterized protein (DUF427 family)